MLMRRTPAPRASFSPHALFRATADTTQIRRGNLVSLDLCTITRIPPSGAASLRKAQRAIVDTLWHKDAIADRKLLLRHVLTMLSPTSSNTALGPWIFRTPSCVSVRRAVRVNPPS